jgi:hypothetical protein
MAPHTPTPPGAVSVTWTVVVPYAGQGDPAREHALRAVVGRLRRDHPWPVLVEPGTEPWSKGAVVDRAVCRTDTDGVIVHDADVLVAPEALERTVAGVTAGWAWGQPHTTVYRLSRRATARFTSTTPIDAPPGAMDLERRAHPAPPGGGIVVVSRRVYDLTGGIDPRFEGWGGEDISWARALTTLGGPGMLGDAPLWHLWHRPQRSRLRGGRGSRDNERLASRYLDAVDDPTAMAGLVGEHRRCGAVVDREQ